MRRPGRDREAAEAHPADQWSAYKGAWPKVFLLLLIVGMVAGFIAGFWTGIMGLCFGAALIATLPPK